jgi:Co/Zn/Cd efflux system component
MGLFALGVLGEVILKLARGAVPAADVMGGVGVLALIANASVLTLLWRHRADDVNMRSAWLCSRNDVLADAGVLAAAGAVALAGSAWPDIIVELLIAGMFATAAVGVMRAARRELAVAAGR